MLLIYKKGKDRKFYFIESINKGTRLWGAFEIS